MATDMVWATDVIVGTGMQSAVMAFLRTVDAASSSVSPSSKNVAFLVLQMLRRTLSLHTGVDALPQNCVAGHVVPHMPQCRGSRVVSTQ